MSNRRVSIELFDASGRLVSRGWDKPPPPPPSIPKPFRYPTEWSCPTCGVSGSVVGTTTKKSADVDGGFMYRAFKRRHLHQEGTL